MKILYIDTTTSYLYTGLVVDKKLVSEVKEDLGKDLSSYTLKEIDTMLKQNHLHIIKRKKQQQLRFMTGREMLFPRQITPSATRIIPTRALAW